MIGKRLDVGESTVVIIRKHWIVFSLHVVFFACIALFPPVAFSFIPAEAVLSLRQLVSAEGALFAYLLYLLSIWLLLFIDLTTYYLDVWVVTNRRIIDINQRTLFARDTTTLMLDRIEDATVEVRGLLATIFNYGRLIVHTAGDNPDIVIDYAADPSNAKDKILECERIARAKGDDI